MLSSTLLPKTQKKRQFPSRCIHPPWRNIEVSGVKTLIALLSTMHDICGPIGTPVPNGARCVSSPGTIP